MALGAAGCAGIAVGVSKMFSVSLPEELQTVKYPLKAKEAIIKCLLSDDVNAQMEHLNKAKHVCAGRYGHISPQYNRLLCWQAKLASESTECDVMSALLGEMLKKPHVGEAVEDEIRRWNYANILLLAIKAKCASDYQASNSTFTTALERLPEFMRNRIDL